MWICIIKNSAERLQYEDQGSVAVVALMSCQAEVKLRDPPSIQQPRQSSVLALISRSHLLYKRAAFSFNKTRK